MANITGNLDKGQLSTMKVDELRKLAADMGLDTAGKKAELIERICAVEVEVDDEAVMGAESTENVDETAENSAEKVEDPALKALREQNELLQRQMEELQKQLIGLQRPQVIQVAPDTERVYFLWQAEVADYNLVTFGPGGMYGSITGKTGTFSVPKNELSRILDNRTRNFLAKRWLIVVDGLDDDEREALGVAYKDGEVLDRKVFARMVDLSVDELREIYPKLCDSHKSIVGQRFYEEWQKKNESVTREKVIALRNMTRNAGVEIAAFQQILQEMNISEEE